MVRDLKLNDFDGWSDLYKGYADFYKAPMNAEILVSVWAWIHDKNHVVKGISYELDGKIVAIAHYGSMPRLLKGQYLGFLDDLFVWPNYRGQRIDQKLIEHLKSLSKVYNWCKIRWITHSSNKNAKKLYDKIANNTGFDLYELKRD